MTQECEVCSSACNNARAVLRRVGDGLPDDSPLRGRLDALRQRIGDVETGVENASMSHRRVIEECGAIAEELRAIGLERRRLGHELNDPRMFEDTFTSRTEGDPHGRARVDNIEGEQRVRASESTRSTHRVSETSNLSFADDADIIYVIRDPRSGAVVKVGQTTGAGSVQRFRRYRTADGNLGLDLEIEINVVRLERPPTVHGETEPPLTRQQMREDVERAVRDRLEGEGHIQPWDYANPRGRMGPSGPGVPFEAPRGSSPLRAVGYRWDKNPESPSFGYLVRPGSGVAMTQVHVNARGIARALRDNPNLPQRASRALGRAAGVSESTLRGWFDDPNFQGELARYLNDPDL